MLLTFLPPNPLNAIYYLAREMEAFVDLRARIASNVLCVLRAQMLQSCLTVCNPMDYSLPDSSVYGVFQARILEWVAMPSSRGSSQIRDQTQVSRIAGGFFTI